MPVSLVKSALFSLKSCISWVPRVNSVPVSIKTDILYLGKSENFQTNPSIHNINTKNKHHLHIITYHYISYRIINIISYHIISYIIHRLNASLSFKKITFYVGIKKISSLTSSVTILKNDKEKFEVALRKCLQTHSLTQ